MKPVLDLLSLVNILGVVQGLFLCVIFFSANTGNRTANRLLGLMILCWSLNVLEVMLCYSGYIAYVPFLVNVGEPFDFLYGPLGYLYVLGFTRPNFRLTFKHALLMLPALAYAIYNLPFYVQTHAYKLCSVAHAFGRPHEQAVKAVHFLWSHSDFYISGLMLDILVFLSVSTFLSLSFYQIYQYARRQGQSMFAMINHNVNWALKIELMTTVVMLVAAVLSYAFAGGDLGDIYITTAVSIALYCLSFGVITQSKVLEKTEEAVARKKYEKSTLDADLSEDSLKKLLSCMEQQQPYLNSNLTLPELSARLSLSTHHLSQLINERLNQNFFDFVNTYRIREVQRKLVDSNLAHIKIEEIAFDTGFNSKSAFNTAFKKITGTTPSQYRKGVSTPLRIE